MKNAIFLLLLITACNVTKSQHYNLMIEGGENHEENLKAAPIIAGMAWNGNLHPRIKKEIPELQGVDLNTVLGLSYQNMTFSSGEKTVFIQCTFKSRFPGEIGDKAIEICRQEVEAEMAKYFSTKSPKLTPEAPPKGE